jgi:hypothetical protein
MYSFHGDDCYRGILDARDGLSSKIIFGFNAQVQILSTDVHDI